MLLYFKCLCCSSLVNHKIPTITTVVKILLRLLSRAHRLIFLRVYSVLRNVGEIIRAILAQHKAINPFSKVSILWEFNFPSDINTYRTSIRMCSRSWAKFESWRAPSCNGVAGDILDICPCGSVSPHSISILGISWASMMNGRSG